MKTFVVVVEEYTRFGAGGQLDLRVIHAASLDECINQLEDWADEDDEEAREEGAATRWLQEANGDGMNYYLVKELRPDGTLSDPLID
jgi:hypothetical protein